MLLLSPSRVTSLLSSVVGDDKYQHINGVNIPQDDDKCARKAIKEWEENKTK